MKVQEILFEEVQAFNKEKLEKLKKGLSKKGDWAFCLGAGVSISMGLPNWYGLIAKMTAQILEIESGKDGRLVESDDPERTAYYKGVERIYESIENCPDNKVFWKKMTDALDGENKNAFSAFNVLESAEYIRVFLKNIITNQYSPKDIEGHIAWQMNHLIKETYPKNIQIKEDDPAIKNTALGAIANLMKERIHNAITYNYDNLLEECLREVCGCEDKKIHSLTKENAPRDLNDKEGGWNIYHVHGRIPVVDHRGEEESESVVFTESDYYQEEHMSYSWTNIIQSYMIERANLIFVGFSGADYNFRRIMKFVDKERLKPERYIFFSVDDIVNAVFQEALAGTTGEPRKKQLNSCIQKMNDKTTLEYCYEKLLINNLVYAQGMYWKEHGLNVIWTSHEELPDDLRSCIPKV